MKRIIDCIYFWSIIMYCGKCLRCSEYVGNGYESYSHKVLYNTSDKMSKNFSKNRYLLMCKVLWFFGLILLVWYGMTSFWRFIETWVVIIIVNNKFVPLIGYQCWHRLNLTSNSERLTSEKRLVVLEMSLTGERKPTIYTLNSSCALCQTWAKHCLKHNTRIKVLSNSWLICGHNIVRLSLNSGTTGPHNHLCS